MKVKFRQFKEKKTLKSTKNPIGNEDSPVSIEAFEYSCWDPKDCELWVTRVKPEETLVEARRGADVQIALQSCL